MSNFTFLTKEQCFGEDKLDILEKRGTKATITDFSIALGGYSDISLEGITGRYWTRSSNELVTNLTVCEVSGRGKLIEERPNWRGSGARLVLPFSSIKRIPTNGNEGKRAEDGILEVEYGYYPQKAASKDMQEELEKAYKSGKIKKTNNTYTTDSVDLGDFNIPFQPQDNEEYEYKGKRYVRIEAKFCFSQDNELSNGEKYNSKDYIWVEVLPVKWLVDEKAKIMITDKIICAGVRFNEHKEYYTEDFDTTEIKKFIDMYLSRDLEQSINIKQNKKSGNTYNLDFSEASEEDIIQAAIQGNIAIFLHGKPGSGKSDRVKQLDPDFIELNLSHLDPELLDGLAGEKDGKAVHIKPPWLEELEEKCKKEPDKIHILFLEELTNASGVMQSKAYGIALDKKVAGRWKLPENTRVVAAGNEIEDSLIANEMAEPLYDRFAHVNIETNAEKWLEWAVTPENLYGRLDYKKEDEARPKIHPAIYAYISYRGDEVLRTPYNSENPTPHADPRRWEMASDMLYASNNPSTLRAIIGEELTRDFIYFCKQPTISVEDVLSGNYTQEEIEEMNLGEKLATVSGLISVEDKDMLKVREFTKKLGPEMCKKFEALWTHGDIERLEELQEILNEEQERKEEGHSSKEAEGTVRNGEEAYKKIDGAYQKFLEREEKDNTKGG